MPGKKYVTIQKIGIGGGAVRAYKWSNSIEEARMFVNRFATGPLEIFERTDKVNTWDVYHIRGKGEGYLISDEIRDGRLPQLLMKWEPVLDEVQLEFYKRVEVIHNGTSGG